MKIVMVTSELAPYSKTGRLGESVAGLASALAARGHAVTCIVPYYRCSWDSAHASPTGMRLTVPIGQKQMTAEIWESERGEQEAMGQGRGGESERKSGIADRKAPQVVFVRRDEYFDRSELYGTSERDYEDNAERFIFLSKIAVEWLRTRELTPDVVHCHDWQTALVPLLLRLEEQAQHVRLGTKTVFTIHDLAHQGVFWSLDFPMTNLPWQFFTPEGLEFYGQMNLLKAGVVFSDMLTTVSRTYAEEIQTIGHGMGLENLLRSRADRLRGIRNGVDYTEWNPESDPHITRHYSAAQIEGKSDCKADLLRRFGLDGAGDEPLIGMVSRLTEQKGMGWIEETLEKLLQTGVRIVVLGKGEAPYEDFWMNAAKRHVGSVGVRIAYDEPLAHQIEAGADLVLMPSRFEPCGMNQTHCLRYGTIPVVHATGGLTETIHEFDPRTGQGNGFSFAEFGASGLMSCLDRALRVYEDKQLWRKLQQNAMSCEFSWKSCADQYLELYEKG
jgi:starch synthase